MMKITKKIKKWCCFLLTVSMVSSSVMITNAESPEEFSEEISAVPTNLSERELRMEEILTSYQEKTLEQGTKAVAVSAQQNELTLQEETVALLNEEGFEAYAVNDVTYEDVQNTLGTELEEIGVRRGYSYIIVMDNEDAGNGDAQVRSSAGASFSYTFNGVTYTLRRVTVTSADDSRMFQNTPSAPLLKNENVASVIRNCLNTAITAYLDAISGVAHLGTVASLCGFDVATLQRPSGGSLTLEANTHWTRKYTQVWSSYDQKWLNGSCVEYATLNSYTHGSYFEAAINDAVQLYRKDATRYSHSKNYSNTTWQNQYAVVGYLNSFIQYDTVGNVQYKYGGVVKITHYEYF